MNPDTSKGSVLLVDDDKFLLDMYSMKFQREGYTIRACLSVDDAIEALMTGFMPDAIVFDILMPGSDGYAFLQKMNELHVAPNAVRIALTNQSKEEERERATSLGADRYVVKASMIPSEVVNTVAEELKKKRAQTA